MTGIGLAANDTIGITVFIILAVSKIALAPVAVMLAVVAILSISLVALFKSLIILFKVSNVSWVFSGEGHLFNSSAINFIIIASNIGIILLAIFFACVFIIGVNLPESLGF